MSASENDTTTNENILTSDDSLAVTEDGSFDEIEKLIDNTEDNGTIKLEGKTYALSNGDEKRLTINKSLNFEGVEGSVIDGKNTRLYLCCVEKEEPDDTGFGHICLTGYEMKNTGKHLTFKNLTFANIDLTEWHNMDFIDCIFINSRLTSYELENTFEKSTFINSTVEIKTPQGMFDENFRYDYSKLQNCELINSTILSRNLILDSYIALIGGTRFEIINKIDITKCNFSKSDIELSYYMVNIDECSFNTSNWTGWSSEINIDSSALINPIINYQYSRFNSKDTTLINSTARFAAGYFSTGNEIAMNNCEIDNADIKIDEGMNSQKSILNITGSHLNNSYIDCKYADINIDDAALDNTKMRLLFTKTKLKNTNLTNNENISEIFKSYNNTFAFENSYLINGSDKTKINTNDIALNNLDEIFLIEKEVYCVGDELIIRFIDSRGTPIGDESLYVEDLTTHEACYCYTDKNGTAKYLLEKSGQIKLRISTPHSFGTHDYAKTLKLNVKSIPIIIKASSITTTYGNKGKLKIQLKSNETNSTLNGFKLTIKIFTGKKYKTYEAVTKSNGIATFKTPAKLAAGKHKVEITTKDLANKKVTVKVNKAKTTVSAPKVTNKFRKSKYFKVTVKNKATKKLVSNVKVKVKVYTAKNYITKTIKTNSKGIAKLNTKSLKIGKHKVVISSGNSNYKISAKSTIIIKK